MIFSENIWQSFKGEFDLLFFFEGIGIFFDSDPELEVFFEQFHGSCEFLIFVLFSWDLDVFIIGSIFAGHV